jgi:hypothetical protein
MITQDISIWVSASSSNTHTKLPTRLWGIECYASGCGTEIIGQIYLHFSVQTFAKYILHPLTRVKGLSVHLLQTYVKRERVT